MQDPFSKRARQVQQTLLAMEQQAAEEDLFSIGYMIPQIELVLEMAEYDPGTVTAEDFDHTYRDWLEMAFDQDGMADDDRTRIDELWQQTLTRIGTTAG